MNGKEKTQIDDISQDVDDILEDTELLDNISEDTDTILKRIDTNIRSQTKIIEGLRKTYLSILLLVFLWIVDKGYVWLVGHGVI